MLNNEVKIDPNDMLKVVRSIELNTVLAVIKMIKQENGQIPDYILDKVAARFNLSQGIL